MEDDVLSKKRITIPDSALGGIGGLDPLAGPGPSGTELVPVNPLEGDKLLDLISSAASPSEIYDQIMTDAATELAYLKASRELAYRASGNFSGISEKTLRGLKTVAELSSMKNKELAEFMHGDIDFHSDGFRNVLGYFLHLVKKSLEDASVPTNLKKTFFVALQVGLSDFEDKAKRLYSGAALDDVINGDKDHNVKV